jgi:hypothetical protein
MILIDDDGEDEDENENEVMFRCGVVDGGKFIGTGSVVY